MSLDQARSPKLMSDGPIAIEQYRLNMSKQYCIIGAYVIVLSPLCCIFRISPQDNHNDVVEKYLITDLQK